MAHYARINSEGIVTDVQAVSKEVVYSDEPHIRESLGPKEEWIKTSYNTRGGKHYEANKPETEDGKPQLRYNYAEVGYHYDKDNDAFYAPQPYPSWILDRGFEWQPPKAMPTTGQTDGYRWNEDIVDWVKAKPEKPSGYDSWTYNAEHYKWEAPVLKPLDGKKYKWWEDDQEWREMTDEDTEKRYGD